MQRSIIFLSTCLWIGISLPAAPESTPPNPETKQAKQDPDAVNPHERKPAEVMGMGGAIWLERPDRIEEERPEVVIAAMELKKTDTVADLGCGTGFFTRRIAPNVPDGRVLAVDIQQGMIDLLKKNLEKEGTKNVVPILSEENDPMLPKAGVDWILLVDVYHEFQNPKPMLQKMLESLSPNGKVALVEYRLEDDTAKHIKKEHRMTIKQVLAEWNPAGFELIDLIETLPSQHLFIFHRRPGYPDVTNNGKAEAAKP